MPTIITRAARVAAAATAPALLLVLGACSLDVLTPNVVPVSATQGETALSARLNGALSDFSVALSGYNDGNAGEGIALLSGLFADEYIASDYFDTHKQVDTRTVQPDNSSNATVLRRLYRALTGAQASADAYVAANQANSVGRATASNRAGYLFTLLAETYCSGLPFSRVGPNGEFIFGAPITTSQMLDSAITKFSEAATAASGPGAADERSAALVGKGRALLDQAKFAAAAAAVAGVSTGFVYATEQSSSADVVKSGNYVLTHISTRYTTANGKGIVGLPFVTANDPRLVTEDLGVSTFDFTTPLNAPAKFGSFESPTVIASGIEARLIEAEAALQAGNYNGGAGSTLAILNSLRASAGLAPLAAVTAPTDRVKQLFSERAFFLFGTAHRLGDLRRLLRAPYNAAPYSFTTGTVFPGGRNAKGTLYGNQVALRVSQAETSNPSYTAGACDPTKP